VRILLLTFHFRPDLSAGSFRMSALAEELTRRMPPGSQLDVITTMSARYRSFRVESDEFEELQGLAIRRVRVPSHRNDMAGQARAYLTYARHVLRAVHGKKYDLVLATSSKLMTALLAAWVARSLRTRLYLDIRDIFVDTIGDVLPRYAAPVAKRVFGPLERWAVNRADRVNLVSPGFATYFDPRYPGKEFSYHTNGIDDEFLSFGVASSEAPEPNRPIRVVYAGNIGEGQGLDAILPELARRTAGRVEYEVIGDGGRRNALVDALAAAGVSNVEVKRPVGRDDMPAVYARADVLFLHLNDYDAFKRVLPSKVFEYAATGKPVLAGVAGYAARFVESEMSNAQVFRPCDVSGALAALDCLDLRATPRPEFIAKYSRAAISGEMAGDIMAVAKGPESVRA
jgi:glycosyltransferase involved in cell wall biosynthesis